MIGHEIYELAKTLWPLNRSITGNGTRQTLEILSTVCSGIEIHEVPSGTQVFDWTVPKEWNVKEAYIVDPRGRKFADFAVNNLHLVGYSIPTNLEMDLQDLEHHLYSLPEQPNAIPYVIPIAIEF